MSLTLLFNPTAAPANTLVIVNNANTQVLHPGSGVYTIEDTGGGVFAAGAVSSVGCASDFILRVKMTALFVGVFLGMNSDRLTDDNYTSIDYAWANPSGGTGQIYESGALVTTPGGSSYFWIWRVGTSLNYGRGATFAIASAAIDRTVTDSSTLYFDSSFGGAGDKAEVLLYLPQDLVGSSSLTFTPSATATGNGALSGTAALTFTPTATASGLGALSGTSALTFSPTSTLTGKGALSGTTSLTFGPSGTLTGKGALSGSGSLAFGPSGTLTGPGALSGTSSLVFAASGTATGTGALSGASSLSFTPSATITGSGALSGTSALTLSPTGTLTGLGDLSGVASVTFAPVGTLSGVVYITGVATLAFTVLGTLTAIDIIAGAKATRRLRESQRRYTDKTGVWR